MRVEPTCPRCGGELHAPNLWSSDWICPAHGAVLPKQPPRSPSREGLGAVLQHARVPLWLPWPLQIGWLVTGFLDVGDERSGARACAVAMSGPGLVSGPADMFLIAEEPGIGLGAHYAGLDGSDPDVDAISACVPHAKVDVLGHPTPMWAVGGRPDRAAFVGEAKGFWLWAVLWPAESGALMLEQLSLLDLRDPGMELDIPFGAFCPRLES